ncbi:hypothetical protein AAY473_026062 [Plecturocebus cupreus]
MSKIGAAETAIGPHVPRSLRPQLVTTTTGHGWQAPRAAPSTAAGTEVLLTQTRTSHLSCLTPLLGETVGSTQIKLDTYRTNLSCVAPPPCVHDFHGEVPNTPAFPAEVVASVCATPRVQERAQHLLLLSVASRRAGPGGG